MKTCPFHQRPSRVSHVALAKEILAQDALAFRKAGVDTMTIKDLGRWESLEMVQRYTRSVTFEDSMKHYKAPLS
jgi:hypothetical protein